MSNQTTIARTREAFLKIRRIEKELEKGNFENLNYFLDFSGQEALDYALEWVSYHGKLELVIKTINRGADPNTSGCVALQMACRNGHNDVVKYLIESGTHNILPDSAILLEAVENNHQEIVKYLLSDQNIFGITLCDVHVEYDLAIRMAVSAGNEEMVKLLISFGADINIFNGYCLEIAIENSYNAIIDILCKKIEI